MPYVVTEACIKCKYMDCIEVCPVDCFYQDDAQLYIDPDECIDCDACIPECPVEAIFSESNVPNHWSHYIQLNAERVAGLKQAGGHITERQEPKEGPACMRQKQ